MSHPPQEGSNRSLPSWTLLAVLWQVCHVWITDWIVSGSILVIGRPSYTKGKLASCMFLGVSWLIYHDMNTYRTSSTAILTKPDYVTRGTMHHMRLSHARWTDMNMRLK